MPESKPHSDPHSSPREFTQVEIEQPLHDFIDMEAYDVVPGETHRRLVEQYAAVQQQLDQERKVVQKRGEEIDRQMRRAEGLEEQLEAAQRDRDEAIRAADGMARAPYGEFAKAVAERDALRQVIRDHWSTSQAAEILARVSNPAKEPDA